jgi:hypothetical protein
MVMHGSMKGNRWERDEKKRKKRGERRKRNLTFHFGGYKKSN